MTLPNIRHKRILVVDDDRLLLAFLETVLSDLANPVVADNGERALEIARTAPAPDLILLDIAMPGLDGHEVCRQLKADPRTSDIPVLFSTAAKEERDEAIGLALGAIDYITKPFRVPVLRARVNLHLQRRQLERQIRDYSQGLENRVRQRTRELEEEIKARVAAEKRLERQLFHDPLTELPNRLQLQRCMQEATERTAPFAVLLVSLVNFHEVNNTLGYQSGSRLLRIVAQRIDACARQLPDVVPLDRDDARAAVLSGVNFGLLFSGTQTERGLTAAAQILLDESDQPIEFEGMSISIGCVIGIALWPRHGDEADTVLRHAHVAVEEAAVADRRIMVYSETINRYSARRLSLMGELRNAIQQNALSLVFQPQLCLADDRIPVVEALLRWDHRLLGSIPPDEFVPLAEQSGIIRPLTQWVLEAAIRQCRDFMDAGLPVAVSVNLSARNLREADLAERILSLLEAYGVPPALLVLEVTETAVMQSPELAFRVLGQLQQAGVRSSIDDFGSGYTSLAYLRRLPVSELKIDRCFVQSMTRERSDALLTQTIIDMAHGLGLQVVAEGVEDTAMIDSLRSMGCDLVQGYYVSRPQPADRLVTWLRRRHLN